MGNSLTSNAANVKFRDELRRVTSETGSVLRTVSSRLEESVRMDEQTPLLGAGRASRRGTLWQVLFDKRHTPGTNNPNPLVKWPAHVWNVTKVTLWSSPVNVLLFFVPLGIVAGKLEWSPTAVFTLNFFAIIPLAAVLSFATEEISKHLGDALGGLLNATFGNAVELIVSIIALRAGEIEVVQASMLGSILSNLLLVMGMCFLLGGLFNNMRAGPGNGTEQSFMSATAQTTCSLMALSSASMILPAALYGILDRADSDSESKERSILFLSRGTAIILLLLYVLFLYFQLHTHKNMFDPSSSLESALSESTTQGSQTEVGDSQTEVGDSQTEVGDETGGGGDESAALGAWAGAAVLVVVTLVISVCADYLVDSIDAIVATGAVSKTFIGLILIPIVGNAAEHVTACVVAVKDNMDLAMGVAIGSSIQIALLVTPFLVILGWIIDQPMTLHFETFETIAFGLSVLVVTYTVQDGKSNYLEGAMLMGLYIIIALAFWASPADALQKGGLWLFGGGS